MAGKIRIVYVDPQVDPGSRVTEGTRLAFVVLIQNIGDTACYVFIDLRDTDGNVLDRVSTYNWGLIPVNSYYQQVVATYMPGRDISLRVVVGHYEDSSMADDDQSSIYTYFYQPPPPADIVLVSYRWDLEEGVTFPYTPDDVRLAYRLTYTVRNNGGSPSEYDVTIYLRNAPRYIGERIAYQHFPSLNPGGTRTSSFVVPETRSGEYYEIEVRTTSTGVSKTYNIGGTPPPEELGIEKPAPMPSVSGPTAPCPSDLTSLIGVVASAMMMLVAVSAIKAVRRERA